MPGQSIRDRQASASPRTTDHWARIFTPTGSSSGTSRAIILDITNLHDRLYDKAAKVVLETLWLTDWVILVAQYLPYFFILRISTPCVSGRNFYAPSLLWPRSQSILYRQRKNHSACCKIMRRRGYCHIRNRSITPPISTRRQIQSACCSRAQASRK